MTHVAGLENPERVHKDSLRLFEIAEELGFHTGWVAQHHLTYANGWLPSPFVFLANVAARTSRLRLGTAVVTVPLENPLRLAEDAVVADLVSDRRIELGLGHGGDADAYEAVGADFPRKREIFSDSLRQLRSHLANDPVVGDKPIQPPSRGLGERIWQGTSRTEGASGIAEAGDGLLIARAPFGEDKRAGTAQRPLVDAYREAWTHDHDPQIGVSRAVYPAWNRAEAVRQVEPGLLRYVQRAIGRGDYPENAGTEEYLRLQNVHIGHPDDVAEALAADLTLQASTEVICQLQPGLPSLGQAISTLELIATEIAPRLGWDRAGAAV